MTKSIRVPGQIRRYVLKEMQEPGTIGEKHLLAACQEGDRALKAKGMNTLNTIDLNLTNAALGEALDIARDWLDDDNGNNVMAGKSMLKYELEYEPADPREIRHEIKMPKSVTGQFMGQYSYEPARHKHLSEVVRADLKAMSWTSTGASGRVRAETLGWFLREMQKLTTHDSSAVQRAAKKFLSTYTQPWSQTEHLIRQFLEFDEDQEHEKDDAGTPTTEELQAAVDGPELVDDEHPDDCQLCAAGEPMRHNYEAPAVEDQEHEPAAVEVKDPLLDLIEETAPPPGGYEVPENFLELAEEGNTPQARAYWKRRCEEYRRTGK